MTEHFEARWEQIEDERDEEERIRETVNEMIEDDFIELDFKAPSSKKSWRFKCEGECGKDFEPTETVYMSEDTWKYCAKCVEEVLWDEAREKTLNYGSEY